MNMADEWFDEVSKELDKVTKGWQTLKLEYLIPPEVREAAEAVNTVISVFSEGLGQVKNALDIAQQLAGVIADNPVEMLMNELLNQIDQLLQQISDEGIGLSFIVVPIQKQFFGPGVRFPSVYSTSQSLPQFRQLLDDGAYANRTSATIPAEVVNFIDNAMTATGGNQGFWKALMLSLQDQGDPYRPLYPSNSGVTGACILFGAQDYAQLMPNLTLFNSLIRAGERTDIAANTRPTPTTISARLITAANSESAFAVGLRWESVSPVVSIPLFSADVYVVDEIFVVRSTDPGFRTKFNWLDVFSREPLDDRSDKQTAGATKVIARIRNDGFVTGYTDISDDMNRLDVYYYAVALRCTFRGNRCPMTGFSICVRIDPRIQTQSRLSTPPDWFGIPNILSLFPVITDTITELRAAVSVLRLRSLSQSGILQTIRQTIRQITAIVEALDALVQDIQKVTQRLTALLSITPQAAISATVITVPTGGTYGWMAELGKRLSDLSDTSRPPFDTGSELVAGVVVLGGSANAAQINTLATLLEALFGASQRNFLLEAINSIEAKAGKSADTPVFGSDMSLGSSSVETPFRGFDEGMNATDKPVC